MNNLNINWFPGHMAKTYKELKDKLKVVDLSVIIIDSRAPKVCFFKELKELVKNKPVLLLFNKIDLCDVKKLDSIILEYKKDGYHSLKIDCKTNLGISSIKNLIEKEILKEKIEKARLKNLNIKPYKIAILGIPNSGKSTLINRINKKNKVIVKNLAGTTKDISWTRLDDDFLLLDTPGLLWPKLNDSDALKLAYLGSIPDDNLDTYLISYNLIKDLIKFYPGNIFKKYGVSEDYNPEEIIKAIGLKKGCLLKGGVVDLETVSKLILKDLRSGLIGKVTFVWFWFKLLKKI